MKNLNLIMFLLAFALTAAIYFLVVDEIRVTTAMPTAFFIFAQGVVFLTGANYRNKEFPLRLPLLLVINPLYFLMTLLILIAAAAVDLSWRVILIAELVAFGLLAFSHLTILMTYNGKKGSAQEVIK